MSLNPLNGSYNPPRYARDIPYDQKELDRRIYKSLNDRFKMFGITPKGHSEENITQLINTSGWRWEDESPSQVCAELLQVYLKPIYYRERKSYIEEICAMYGYGPREVVDYIRRTDLPPVFIANTFSTIRQEDPAPKEKRTVIGQKFTQPDEDLLKQIYDRVKDDPKEGKPRAVLNVFKNAIEQEGREFYYTYDQVAGKLSKMDPKRQVQTSERIAVSSPKFPPEHFLLLKSTYLAQKKLLDPHLPSPVTVKRAFSAKLSKDIYCYNQIYRIVHNWNKNPHLLEAGSSQVISEDECLHKRARLDDSNNE